MFLFTTMNMWEWIVWNLYTLLSTTQLNVSKKTMEISLRH